MCENDRNKDGNVKQIATTISYANRMQKKLLLKGEQEN
jgi:hypothetical protein